MEIQNYDNLVKYRVYTVVGLFVFVTLYTLSVLEFFADNLYKMPVVNYVLIVSALLTMVLIYTIYINVSFFYFSDEKDKLEFKYFSLNVFKSKRYAVEISKRALHDFEIIKLLGGRKVNLILYAKTKTKIAQYPTISLTFVKKSDIQKLNDTLSLYAMKKNRN